jgi:hypothetical protein
MSVRPTASQRIRFEVLESRQLLTTFSVTDYGARPNDFVDDAAAIQRAINASGPGDTILFPTGTYHVSKSVTPKGEGRIIRGEAGANLQTTSSAPSLHFSGKNLTITGMTFSGRGIFFDSRLGDMVENLVIDNNRFNLDARGGLRQSAIEFTTGLRNSRITNNTFDAIRGDNGIYGFYWDGLLIANNAFMNGNEGMHMIDHSGSSRDLTIEQNYFSGLHRMGVEYQGGGWNTLVQDNYYENPVLFGSESQNLDVFAYSIVADKSNNTVVRRNYARGVERPDGRGVRVMYELGGFGLQMYDNYSEGGFNVIAVNGTRANGVVRDNRISNYLNGPYNANGATVQFINNGPDVQLTWDINRPKPGPNGRLNVDPTPPPHVDPSDGNNAPSNLTARMLNANTVELRWKDNSTDEIGFKVERSFDGVNFKQIALLVKNAQRFTNSGLPAGKPVYYRIRSYNAVEVSGYSNVASITPTGSSTPVPPGGTPVTPPPTTRPPTTPSTGGGPVTVGGTSAGSQVPGRTTGTSPGGGTRTIQQIGI